MEYSRGSASHNLRSCSQRLSDRQMTSDSGIADVSQELWCRMHKRDYYSNHRHSEADPNLGCPDASNKVNAMISRACESYSLMRPVVWKTEAADCVWLQQIDVVLMKGGPTLPLSPVAAKHFRVSSHSALPLKQNAFTKHLIKESGRPAASNMQ